MLIHPVVVVYLFIPLVHLWQWNVALVVTIIGNTCLCYSIVVFPLRILLPTSYSSVYLVFFCLPRILLSTSYSSVYFVFFCLLRILLSTSYSSVYFVFFCLLRILLPTSYSSVYFVFFCLLRILLSTSYSSVYLVFFCLPRICGLLSMSLPPTLSLSLRNVLTTSACFQLPSSVNVIQWLVILVFLL